MTYLSESDKWSTNGRFFHSSFGSFIMDIEPIKSIPDKLEASRTRNEQNIRDGSGRRPMCGSMIVTGGPAEYG
jgi:hypothetical protein